MKKIRVILYWAILLWLAFLYYSIGHIFYSIISDDGLPLLMVAFVISPMALAFALLRIWVLKPINQRPRFFDLSYFVIPVIIEMGCFGVWIWTSISLCVLAEIMIGCEFIWSIIKIDFLIDRRLPVKDKNSE